VSSFRRSCRWDRLQVGAFEGGISKGECVFEEKWKQLYCVGDLA